MDLNVTVMNPIKFTVLGLESEGSYLGLDK